MEFLVRINGDGIVTAQEHKPIALRPAWVVEGYRYDGAFHVTRLVFAETERRAIESIVEPDLEIASVRVHEVMLRPDGVRRFDIGDVRSIRQVGL